MEVTRSMAIVMMLITVIAVPSCRQAAVPASPPPTDASPADAPPGTRLVGPLSTEDASALATMNDRLKEYFELHRKVAGTLPPLPKEATPQQIDQNQRALGRLIREHRSTARQGKIFTPEARPVIRRLLEAVFAGPDGKQLAASVMDENPTGIRLAVNGRYPDTVPLSTVPPEVLQTLPKLPEPLEYRFIGTRLILLDVPAHLVVDYIEVGLPT